MNNISQISIFDYSEIEILGDLEKLRLFFDTVDDETLCEQMEKNTNKKIYKKRLNLHNNIGTFL